MNRLPTAEEDARYNPYTGSGPDPTLPERITITCGKSDRWNNCRFVANLDGVPLHHGKFDPYSEYHRGLFAESVFTKAENCPPDETTDLRWIGDAVVEAANRSTASTAAANEIEPYTPFPIEVLPVVVGDFVRAASSAIGCDSSFIALPILACLARAIGNKRVIRLKGGSRPWHEPAIIWAAIVGKSGTHKTPALQAATSSLSREQQNAITAFRDATARHDQELAIFDRDYQAWKRSKTSEPPPSRPLEPVCERYITTDCTIEALASLLHSQFDGVLIVRDELAGWLGGIAEYKGGKGSDLGHWLASWSAAPLTVDRKTGTIKMIHVPRAAVSIMGGIQPGVLRKAIGLEHMQDGLCARLLLAMPDSKPVLWTEAIVDENTEAAITEIFERFIAMMPGVDEDGNPEPLAMPLSDSAKRVWVEFYNRHGAEHADLDDDLSAAWSKLKAYTARFALIFQLCSWAAGEQYASEQIVDEAAMRSAIVLSDWFGGEARRVYGLFGECEADRDTRELVEWISRKGGGVTVREVQQGHRRFANASEGEAALGELEKAGYGQWHVTQTAGRPRREFKLSIPSRSTEVRESAEIQSSVGVDAVDAPHTHNGDAAGFEDFERERKQLASAEDGIPF